MSMNQELEITTSDMITTMIHLHAELPVILPLPFFKGLDRDLMHSPLLPIVNTRGVARGALLKNPPF